MGLLLPQPPRQQLLILKVVHWLFRNMNEDQGQGSDHLHLQRAAALSGPCPDLGPGLDPDLMLVYVPQKKN